MKAAQGTIACPAGTGNFSVTSTTFTPTVVLFWGTKQTAEGIVDDNSNFFGAATSSTQRWAISQYAEDNVATTDFTRYGHTGACIHILTSTTASSVIADFVSMNSNGFTVAFSAVVTNTIIHWMALNPTTVKAGFITIAATSGNQDFTDPGFTPDCTILAGIRQTSANWNAFLLNTTLILGAGTSSSARWATSICGNDAETMTVNVDAMGTQRTDNIYLAVFENGTIDAIADYSGGIANGFRLNVSKPHALAHQVGYVCFQGGSYAVGAFSAPTVDGNTNDVNVGFTPEAVLFSTWNKASSTSILANNDINVGAAIYGGTEGCVGSMTVDAVLNTQADSYSVTTKAIRTLLAGSPMTVSGEADSDLTGIGGANTFRLTWPNAPTVAAEVCYVAFGPHESASTPAPLFPYAQQYMRTGR